MFDVPFEDRASLTWQGDLPVEDHDWSVGLIIGPSGSGKTTLARHLWPEQVVTEFAWSPKRALIDDFPSHLGIREVTGLLNSVGLASPPAWLRPFSTLSNGEAFRATVARALSESADIVVMDEFTSVVDRQVAKVASHTVQKIVRKTGRQFVAVTCHYDVVEWLQPDWIYDVAASEFIWRSVQPHPPVDLNVYKVDRSAWRVFARHHYLSSNLSTSAQCFGGFVGDDLVAFTSYLHFPHAKTKSIKMAHRIVVLPDWQGLGIAGVLSEWMGDHLYSQGYRYRITTGHPGFIKYLVSSPRWAWVGARNKRIISNTGNAGLLHSSNLASSGRRRLQLDPRSLNTRSFEYRRAVGETQAS